MQAISSSLSMVMLTGLLAACVLPSQQDRPRETLLFAVARQPDEIGRVVVPVNINGAGPYYFMVDTGATHTLLTEAATQRLGLSPDTERRVRVRGISGVSTAPTAVVTELRAGDLALQDRRMPVLSGPVFEGLDGILGMDGLVDRRISIDFLQDRVSISQSSGQPAASGYTVLPFMQVSSRLPVIMAHIGGVKVRAVVDTGATQTLGNMALFRALLRRSGKDSFTLVGVTDATQQVYAGPLWTSLQLHLDTLAVDKVEVAFGRFQIFDHWMLTRDPALLLGMDVLGSLGELHLDYVRQELQLRAR